MLFRAHSYKTDIGSCPSEEQGLKALVQKPIGADKWNGPYTKKKIIPRDPWGNKLVYKYLNGGCIISSYGADGIEGGTNDDADIKQVIPAM